MEEWSKTLALAPVMAVRKTLEATAQLALDLESDCRLAPKRHWKSHLPFFKHPRLRDNFYVGDFCPSAKSAQDYACAQKLAGKETGRWEGRAMKKESRTPQLLQDFV